MHGWAVLKTVKLDAARKSSSRIHIGCGFDDISRWIDLEKTILVADEHVASIYSARFPAVPVITMPQGESCKTRENIFDLCEKLLALGADRSSFVLAVGGGALTDAAGFASSIFMRGVRFGFVPTTLLSQVDASVGGKNGINFGGAKNMIGTINQPEFVLCDPSFISTISDTEYLSGFAEIIKHALIKDSRMYDDIKRDAANLRARSSKELDLLIYKSVKIKAAVVKRDETEKGDRRLLNFGHTIGHAIESAEKKAHGIALGAGMNLAAAVSRKLGYLSEKDYNDIRATLEFFGYPLNASCSPEIIKQKVMKDKKKEGSAVNFVLLRGIGKSFCRPIPSSDLEVLIDDLCVHP